jgi:DNA-directed RNA polymerase specialized sigma24 family protein
MVQRLMGHEETPKISKARIYGYYFSSLGLNRRQLRRHYKALTPRQREVAAMYYFEERTVEEVATALGVTKGAVSRCLSRARRRMALEGE